VMSDTSSSVTFPPSTVMPPAFTNITTILHPYSYSTKTSLNPILENQPLVVILGLSAALTVLFILVLAAVNCCLQILLFKRLKRVIKGKLYKTQNQQTHVQISPGTLV
jgi:hypothetical protein